MNRKITALVDRLKKESENNQWLIKQVERLTDSLEGLHSDFKQMEEEKAELEKELEQSKIAAKRSRFSAERRQYEAFLDKAGNRSTIDVKDPMEMTSKTYISNISDFTIDHEEDEGRKCNSAYRECMSAKNAGSRAKSLENEPSISTTNRRRRRANPQQRKQEM